MSTVEPLVTRTYPHYAADPDLYRVALNSVSWLEAYLAIELLAEREPSKVLVSVANLREAIRELPRLPFAMAIDFETLAQVWRLEREGNAWSRAFEDESGAYYVVVMGEGSYCYDIIVRTGDETLTWLPEHGCEDLINPRVVDAAMERPGILGSVLDLLSAMGLPFNPAFYMSLEDWRQEYAQTVFEEIVDTFQPGEIPLPARRGRRKKPTKTARSKAKATN